MTKKFEKAKAETIQKYTKVLEAIKTAQREESCICSFCRCYSDCIECPVDTLCSEGLHLQVRWALTNVAEKVEEGLSSLKKLKEKQPRKRGEYLE